MAYDRINRRQFLASTAYIAGLAVPGAAWSARRPCPPPSLSVDGGAPRNTACARPLSQQFPTLRLNTLSEIDTHAWTFGQPFIRGAVMPDGLRAVAGASALQVDVRNLWDDGSLKFAVLSGVSTFRGGTVDVVLGDSGVRTTGANVAEPAADWLASNVVVTLSGDGAGTYTPGPARIAGKKVWDRLQPHKRREIPGPVMSEFHYYTPTSDAHLTIWWYVRCYVNGAVEVETVVENGWVGVPSPYHKKYGVRVRVGGSERYATDHIGSPFWHVPSVRVSDVEMRIPGRSDEKYFVIGNTLRFLDDPGTTYTVVARDFVDSGTNITVDRTLPAVLSRIQIDGHCNHSRWSRVDWVGNDPLVMPQHSGDYIMASWFSPNYFKGSKAPSSEVLNALPVPVEPFERGFFPDTMGAPGSNSEPVMRPAVLYLTTNGDARAWRSTIAHGHAAGRYGIYYRDEDTGEPVVYASRPNHTYSSGAGFSTVKFVPGAVQMPSGGTLVPGYAKSHAPQLAYVPYLLTGRHSFRETCEFQAQVSYFVTNSKISSYEGSRIALAAFSVFYTRGAAWCIRSMMEVLAVLPDSEPRARQYAQQLGKTLAYYDDKFTGKNALSVIQPKTGYADGKPVTASASFMEHYFSVACAWAVRLVGHRLDDADRSRAERFANWRLKHVVGLMGYTNGYCYRDAAYYTPAVAEPNLSNVEEVTPEQFNAGVYPDWKTAYEKTAYWDTTAGSWVGPPVGDACDASNALRGKSGSSPGALTADDNSYWALTQSALAFAVDYGVPGASESWARLVNSSNYNPEGFRNRPDWGIVPRR